MLYLSQNSSCKRLKVSPDYRRYSAKLRGFPQLIHGEQSLVPSFPQCFKADVRANFVAIFETVDNCFGWIEYSCRAPSMMTDVTPVLSIFCEYQTKRTGNSAILGTQTASVRSEMYGKMFIRVHVTTSISNFTKVINPSRQSLPLFG